MVHVEDRDEVVGVHQRRQLFSTPVEVSLAQWDGIKVVGVSTCFHTAAQT